MWKLRGHIRKIEEDTEKLEPGCYITIVSSIMKKLKQGEFARMPHERRFD